MTTAEVSPSAALAVEGLTKAYGGTQALDDVVLTVRAGEIHGLVGRNGSGKSTLIKILSGYVSPDPGGTIQIFGQDLALPVHPRKARDLGLAFVHQDLALAPALTVRDNVRVGHYDGPAIGRIARRKERDRIMHELQAVGSSASPETLISELSPVERVLVAVARARSSVNRSGPALLVLDEPTSQLPASEIERLFVALRQLVENGSSVILVTHRIEEVFDVTDSVSVLRDGKLVVTDATKNLRPEQLVELMIGEPLEMFYPDSAEPSDDVNVTIEGLKGADWGPISLSMRRGEILGLTGLPGMGHDRIPLALFGADPAATGMVTVAGNTAQLRDASPRSMMSMGVGYLPADRTRESGAGSFTVRENVTLPVVRRFVRGWRLSRRAETTTVDKLLKVFRVVPEESEFTLSQLSGGNQQKALLAKWHQLPPKLFVVHEPTQGIDVSAKTEVFRQLLALAREGNSVLFVSVEHKDLANVCHRVLVMHHGTIVDELAGSRLTENAIVKSALNVART